MNNSVVDTSEALANYLNAHVTYCEPYGNGHINNTFLVIADKRYILQGINTSIFTRPDELMENIIGVTEHIRNKAAEDKERATLVIIPTLDGQNFFCDSHGKYWRMFEFTERTVTFEAVEKAEDFYNCAVAFGQFQRALADYPAHTLHETIINFHNTPIRYENLMRAAENDVCGRLAEVTEELKFAKARREFCSILENAHACGDLPLRVTHNDTKLNNILFDEKTSKPVCVIDLDTVMPGYSVNDFGDSIRFGANTANEASTDYSNVKLDLELFEAYTKGFLEGCDNALTETEIKLLPIGAIMMTLECGMRFLTDYLEGDVYFRIHRPKQNLERARNQFALVADMEKKMDEMNEIVQKYM